MYTDVYIIYIIYEFSKARKASSVLSPAPFVNQIGKTR